MVGGVDNFWVVPRRSVGSMSGVWFKIRNPLFKLRKIELIKILYLGLNRQDLTGPLRRQQVEREGSYG